jgi:hypothetical protein
MLAGWAAVAAAPAYSADRQQRFVIQHATDTVDGRASWAVVNDGADLARGYGGLAGWRRAELPYLDGKRWVAPAATLADERPPKLHLLAGKQTGKLRTIAFRLEPNGAESVTLVADKEAGITSAGTAGFVRPIAPDAKGKYYLQCFGRSCGGAVIEFTTAVSKPLTITLVGSRRGLPATAHALLDQRPRFARPQYSADSTITISRVAL